MLRPLSEKSQSSRPSVKSCTHTREVMCSRSAPMLMFLLVCNTSFSFYYLTQVRVSEINRSFIYLICIPRVSSWSNYYQLVLYDLAVWSTSTRDSTVHSAIWISSFLMHLVQLITLFIHNGWNKSPSVSRFMLVLIRFTAVIYTEQDWVVFMSQQIELRSNFNWSLHQRYHCSKMRLGFEFKLFNSSVFFLALFFV